MKPGVKEALSSENMQPLYPEAEKPQISVFAGEKTGRITVAEILYIEVHGRVLTIHTQSEICRLQGSLQSFAALLPPESFAVPYKGYLVNLHAVSSLSSLFLTLHDGTRIPVSRGYAAAFSEALQRIRTAEGEQQTGTT